MLGSFAMAQSVAVSGVQSGIWDADTVRVTGDVQVHDTLAILAGTTVLFDGFYSIEVANGAVLTAQGTASDSVVFTVADTTGFYLYNTGDGGWNGFQLDRAGRFQLDYCVLQYSKASDTTDMYGGALMMSSCDDVEISHTSLRCNRARIHGGALNAENSHVVMTDCSVNDNAVFTNDNSYYRYGGALRFFKCDVEMRVMEFLHNNGEGCIGGALSLDSCSVVLDRAVFVDNIGINGGGLYMMRSNHLSGRLSNLLFDNNFSRHFGGGLAFSDTSPDVYNILVTNNDSEGVNCTGIFFYQYCSPKFANCIIYGNYPTPGEINPDTTQMWLWTFEGYAPQFRNCLIEGGTKYITNGDLIKVFENIQEGDPLFVDAGNHDFHLSEGSPCRDAGCEAVPGFLADGFDLDGNPRVMNQRIDIGPYEYPGPVGVSQHLTVSSGACLLGNPLHAKSRVEFDRELSGEAMVSVYAITGRLVAQKEDHLSKSSCLELGDLVERLEPGVYLIEVKLPTETFILKAVK